MTEQHDHDLATARNMAMVEQAHRASSTTITGTKGPVDLAEQKKKNDAWIAAYKKASGVKKQTVLPSPTQAHNEWAVREGYSMQDAITWRNLCEKAKFGTGDIEAWGFWELLCETVDIAHHCDTNPIGLIAFARASLGIKEWSMETIDLIKDQLIPEEPNQDDDQEDSSGGKKRKYEATQDIDEDIDDK